MNILNPLCVYLVERTSHFLLRIKSDKNKMGCQKYLPRLWKEAKILMTTPAEDAASHGIHGINDGADFLCDMSKVDEIVEIKTIEAKERARLLTRKNGLLVGISSGANILAAEKWLQNNNPRGVVVTFLCDRGERYLSCH